MKTNPFDDPATTFSVLANLEGQHSLWPGDIDVPDGWKTVLEQQSRDECIEYIEAQWTDMRPSTLIR